MFQASLMIFQPSFMAFRASGRRSMAATVRGLQKQDMNYRRRAAERAAATPPLEIQARNNVIHALSGLGAPRAFAVLRGVEKSIEEYLAVQARAGL
jgi:hypothetical protein